MSSTTPFIDSLSPQDRQKVIQRSLGDKRPSFYSSELAKLNALNKAAPSSDGFVSPDVQISPDFEATLILLSEKDKKGIIQFILDAFKAEEPADELELMTNTLVKRKANYDQANSDTYAPALRFDKSRASVLAFVESKRSPVTPAADDPAPQVEDNIDAVVPELSYLFSSLSTEYLSLTKPEILEMHNRIVDSQVLNYFTDEAAARKSELLSWQTVIQLYL